MNENNRVSIHICTRDRFSELFGLLLSLKFQTYQNFDIVIVDASRPKNIMYCDFLYKMISRLRNEGHGVQIISEDVPLGIGKSRNLALNMDKYHNEYCLRLDDDSICEPDYVEKLVTLMDTRKYSAVSGVVPLFGMPRFDRSPDLIKIFNEIKYDTEGNITYLGDDAGYTYYPDRIFPAHHLRSSFMFLRTLAQKIRGFPVEYGSSGFREETDFCIRLAYADKNLKFAVDSSAVNWHVQANSGGVRNKEYANEIGICDDHFRRKMKMLFKNGGNPFV